MKLARIPYLGKPGNVYISPQKTILVRNIAGFEMPFGQRWRKPRGV